MLTICYCTSRKDPKLEWFLDSLDLYCVSCVKDVNLVVVDFHCPKLTHQKTPRGKDFTRVPPKPTVWQGPGRLTNRDFFAPANARNTGLCLAPDGWIAFVDDLSVLMPGWLDRVRDAIAGNYVVCGRYQKVKNLVVKKGEVVSYDPFDGGLDARMAWMTGKGERDTPRITGGEWLFGCSLAAPVEAMLSIGGFPEIADGLGGEDYMAGIALERQGYTIKYDPRMMTLESEEHHYSEPPMVRYDKGKSPNDKSHAALKMVHNGMKYFENYHPGGMRALRQHILSGGEFPPCSIPDRDWWDGMLLSEM